MKNSDIEKTLDTEKTPDTEKTLDTSDHPDHADPQDDDEDFDLSKMLGRRRMMMADCASGSFFQPSARAGAGAGADARAGAASSGPAQFNSGEHAVIPSGKLKFDSGDQAIGTYLFKLQNGLELTYGQLVALSGDFYADYRRPISNQTSTETREAVALSAFAKLSAPSSFKEATNILAIMNDEIKAIQSGELFGLPPSRAYGNAGDQFDQRYNGATGGASSNTGPYKWYFDPGRYLKLASTNWDHFGLHAWTAYNTFHTLAIEKAIAATTDDALAEAYALNAFGDHYLTDMFASGHIRTPRRELYAKATSKTKATAEVLEEFTRLGDIKYAGACAKNMHDEDNFNGLWVANARGDRWLCYGDTRYRDTENYANALLAQQAVAASIDAVWTAYKTKGVPPESTVKEYLPLLLPHLRANYAPLYSIGYQEKLVRRTSLTNVLEYSTLEEFDLEDSYDDYQSRNKSGIATGTSLFASIGKPSEETAGKVPLYSSQQSFHGEDLTLASGAPVPIPTTPLASVLTMGVIPPLMSVACKSSGNVEVAALVNGNTLRYNNGVVVASSQEQTWQAWKSTAAGDIASAPSLVESGGTYYAFYVSRGLGLRRANLTTGASAESIGIGTGVAPFASAPVAVATSSRTDVFVVDANANVQTRHFANNAWSAWQIIPTSGAAMLGTPTAFIQGSTLYLCAVTRQGHLYWCKNSTTATSWASVTWDAVAVRGVDPQSINTRASIAGWNSDALYFFSSTKLMHGNIWYSHLEDGRWKTDGDVIGTRSFISPPTAVLVYDFHIEVFAVGSDNKVYRASFVNKTWTEFTGQVGDVHWQALPDIVAISPVSAVTLITSDSKHPMVMVTVIDHAFELRCLTLKFDGNKTSSCTASAWQTLNETPAA